MTQDKAFFESPDSKLQDDVSGLIRAARLPAQLENIIGRRYVLRFGEARRTLCGTITGVYIETDGDGNMTLMELQVSNPGALPGVTIRCLRCHNFLWHIEFHAISARPHFTATLELI